MTDAEWEEAVARARATRAASHARQSGAARARARARGPYATDAATRARRQGRHARCGTATAYRYGCRCDQCKDAKRLSRGIPRASDPRPAIARADRNRAYRRALYVEAAAAATGDLAVLIAEQQADAQARIVWSISLNTDIDPHGVDVEWHDPTADLALARLAA